MAINNLETASLYSEELDRLFIQKSATGFFADNAFGARFVGAKTVIVPDIDFQGLADYDRDTGFTRGSRRKCFSRCTSAFLPFSRR